MVLSLELYDGTADLREHILRYHNAMEPLRILKDKREAMICKMFSNSLKRLALTKYYRLKPTSIDSFGDLSKKFQRKFTLSMKAKKELNHLFFMIQQRDESLRSYTQHLNNKMLEVKNCHDSVAIQVFRRSLINGTPFYNALTMRTPMKNG